MQERVVILRHDFDRVYAVGDAMDICLGIEEKYGCRSTCFLRYDRGIGNDLSLKDKFRYYEEAGWEFAFHLSNHVGSKKQDTPEYELNVLSKLGLKIEGVSLCGSVNPVYVYSHVQRDAVDNLSLKYFSPHLGGLPKEKFKTPVLPDHTCFEYYHRREEAFEHMVNDLEIYLKHDRDVTLMTHPDYLSEEYIAKRNINWNYGESVEKNIELYENIIDYITTNYRVMTCIEYYNERIK